MNKRKIALMIVFLFFLAAGSGVTWYYWYQTTHYVKTEDAKITGDIYRVMPQVSAKLEILDIKEGDQVMAGQIVGRQDATNLPPTMLDHVLLRAPVSGIVLKTLAKPGEVVAPGQPVALIADPHQFYVSANIEETKIKKVKVGQLVDFTVDAYPGMRFKGKVRKIGEATLSTFSLFPSTNTSGNFIKVTQRIPIEISFMEDPARYHFVPGMNVYVRIHIR